MTRLDLPLTETPVIHIAGTNGKTTTARMIDGLLRTAGLRVGRFTSPHLRSVRERVVINGAPISRARLEMAHRQTRAAASGLSFFETLTLMALWDFAHQELDVVVVEAGLGGRDDGTNVLEGCVGVITTVGLDHVETLGGDIVGIAEHKAGIIKAGASVVVGPQPPEAQAVISKRSRQSRAREVILIGRDAGWSSRRSDGRRQHFRLRTPHALHDDLVLPLLGEHQLDNAATAVVAAEAYLTRRGARLPGTIVRRSLELTSAPGRLELVRRDPLCLVDMSHNPLGMRATARAIHDAFGDAPFAVVLAVPADKDGPGIIRELVPFCGALFLSDNGSDRCLPPGELAPIAHRSLDPGQVFIVPDLGQAVAAAERSGLGRTLITGSVLTAAAARRNAAHERGQRTAPDTTAMSLVR